MLHLLGSAMVALISIPGAAIGNGHCLLRSVLFTLGYAPIWGDEHII